MTTLPIRFALPGFAVDAVKETTQGIEIHAHAIRPEALCPACGSPSISVHSTYNRTLRDLPCSTYAVRLVLSLRRFRCRNATCTRQTFAEPLTELAPAFARRTDRLTTILQAIGFTIGGEAGSRLTTDLRLQTSADTLLRIVRRMRLAEVPTPRVLGVDDWAQTKGCVYGTILVDLEQHRVIDLLADRTAETLTTWLQAHPGIEIITRDRSLAYARGIAEGAPDARQVADRWHLLRNLREALERLLNRFHAQLSHLPVPSNSEGSTQTPAVQRPRRLRTVTKSERIRQQASRARRQERYEAVHALAARGVSERQIARRLGMARGTVRTFLQAEAFPERALRRAAPSIIDPFIPYLQERWDAGCTNASGLWREIRKRGYPGTRRQVARWAQHKRKEAAPTTPRKYLQGFGGTTCAGENPAVSTEVLRLPTPRKLAWLLLRAPGELTDEERATAERIQQEPKIVTARELAQQFQAMVRNREPEEFDGWLVKCSESDLPDLRTFAEGLQRDREAVLGAMTEEWSNGQVEGQITRLKLIKRQMYGRAKLDLLRKRVLHAA